MVESENLRAKMRDVLESVHAEGAIQLPVGDEPFLVLNPGYHNGQRASFLLLPSLFCRMWVFGPSGIKRQDVWSTPIGRLLTVTDRGIVLTVTAAQQMLHVTCDVTEEFSSLGGSGVTMGSLDKDARADGWLVPWSDFDAVMTDLSKHYRLAMSHSQLMKLPPGVVKGKGGES